MFRERMMRVVLHRIYEAALPRLQGKWVKDLCVGLELLAVQLDGGEVGVAYVLRGDIPCGCGAPWTAGEAAGMSARDLAAAMRQEANPLSAAVGVAVCNAVADYDALASRVSDAADAFDVRPGDTVGMVGNIGPVARQLRPKARRLIIFDRGQREGVYPDEDQERLLPKCDLVVVTGSTLLNGTFDQVLARCRGAREVVLTGGTTPLYPAAFRDTGVTVLAGCRWFPQYKDQIFARVAQGACLGQITKYGQKLTVRLNTV